MEQYEYLDCLIDFAGAIQVYGAEKVAKDFHQNYPAKNSMFMQAALMLNKQRQTAALFKPTLPKDE